MEDKNEFVSNSLKDTQSFAMQCAESAQNGDVITLEGPMGAGKTAFARHFIQHLVGEEIDVPSPTFTLVQTYETSKGTIWHFDLYRLEDADEIYEIGWEEAISDGILLIEWPERLGNLLPWQRKEIKITAESDIKRLITLDVKGSANDK